MAKWSGNKVNPEQINNGNEYTVNDNVSIEELNGIVNNSFKAQKDAEQALELATGANEANGTVVKINGEPQGTWDATFSQELYEESANIIDTEDNFGVFEGVEYKTIKNKTILNGTATYSGNIWIKIKKPIKAGTIFSFNQFTNDENLKNGVIWLGKAINDWDNRIQVQDGRANISVNYDINYISIYVTKGTNYSLSHITPMAVLGKVKPTTYFEYNPNRHITNSEAEFLREEHNKTINEFDKNNPKILNSYITSAGIRGYDAGSTTIIVEIKPNTDYVVSKKLSNPISANRFVIGTTTSYPTYNMALNSIVKSTDGTETTQLSIRTSANDKYLVAYIHSNLDTISVEDMLDTIQIEKGSVATPRQPYNSSSHITNEQADLLKSEWEKSVNLFKQGKSANYFLGYLESGKKYCISANLTLSNGATTYTGPVNRYDINTGQTSANNDGVSRPYQTFNTSGINSYVITCNVSGYYEIETFNVPNTNIVVKNIMINEGTEPLPYQEWNGSIIHENDIKPVLLWKNGNPNAEFLAQDITTNNLDSFNKFIVVYKVVNETDSLPFEMTFDKKYGSYSYITGMALHYMGVLLSRAFKITDNTHIRFGSGNRGSTTDTNNFCIPVAIYGVK